MTRPHSNSPSPASGPNPGPNPGPAGAPPGSKDRARALREAAVRRGRPDRWCEALYREAGAALDRVFWADQVPNPMLVERWERWRADLPPSPRVLVTGAGYGDDAAWLADQGARVSAFDVSPSAVRRARERFPSSPVRWFAGDLLAPPVRRGAPFDLVVEVYTLQVLPPERRALAWAPLTSLVAPGGELWLVARARTADEDPGELPWPLLRGELDRLDREPLEARSVEEFLDQEEPPARRLVARYRRPDSTTR
jgi:hypothetical protein